MKKIFKAITIGISLGLFGLILASCGNEANIENTSEITAEITAPPATPNIQEAPQTSSPAIVGRTIDSRYTFSGLFSGSMSMRYGVIDGDFVTIYAPYNIIEGELNFPEGDFSSLNISFPVDIHIVEDLGNTLLSYRMDSRLVDILGVYIEDGVLNIRANKSFGWQNYHTGQADMVIYLNASAIRNTISTSGSTPLHLGSLEFDDILIQTSGSSVVSGDIATNNFEFRASGSGNSFINLNASSANITLSGTTLISGNITSDNVNLTLSGSGHNNNLEIYAKTADIRLSGTRKITLFGQSVDATVSASGMANMDLQNFAIQNATASASGSANIILNVSNNLTITNQSRNAQISNIATLP